MNIEMNGRIASIGQIQTYRGESTVLILIAEEDNNSSLLPIEFYGDGMQQTTLILPGQKARISFKIVNISYERNGQTKHLARLQGSTITPIAE